MVYYVLYIMCYTCKLHPCLYIGSMLYYNGNNTCNKFETGKVTKTGVIQDLTSINIRLWLILTKIGQLARQVMKI